MESTATRKGEMRNSAGCLALLLVGCVPTPSVQAPTQITIPAEAEFQEPNLKGYPALTEDEAAYRLSMFFAKRGLLTRLYRDDDYVRIITRPTEEPEQNQRFRRVSYHVTIQLFGPRASCTWVEVRWYLESRGRSEADWREEPDPEGFKPLLAGELEQFLRSRQCK